MSAFVTSEQLYNAIKKRFPLGQYATLWEVANGTGRNKSRSADALVFSVWPSRGLHMIGIEVKASRSDWVKERDDPAKSAAIQRYCDYWYLVTAPGIVQPGELPETWGHLELRGHCLRGVKEAPKLKPEPFTLAFAASLMRSMAERPCGCPSTEILKEKYDEGLKEGRRLAESDRKYEDARTKDYLEVVKNFEKVSGIEIDRYRSGCLAEELKDFREFRLDVVASSIRHLEKVLANWPRIEELAEVAENLKEKENT